jgi:hypothetical protein
MASIPKTLVRSLLVATCLLGSLTLAGGAVGASLEVARAGATEILPTPVESPHPYPPGAVGGSSVWSALVDVGLLGCTGCAGAQWTKLHFSQFQLGEWDYVEVSDFAGTVLHRYDSGETDDLWALSVPGEQVRVELFADPRGSDTGVVIDRVAYGFAQGFEIPADFCDVIVGQEGCGDYPANDAIRCFPNEYAASLPTARIIFGFDDICWGSATGFLIDRRGTMLTNNHVIATPLKAATAEAQFRFESPLCTSDLPPIPTILENFRTRRILETDEDCDVTTFRILGGDVAARLYGITRPSDRNPQVDDLVYLPQHPGAGAKKLDSGPVDNIDLTYPGGLCPGGVVEYTLATRGGSSGSPLMDTTNRFVGIHSGATCPTKVGTDLEQIQAFAGAYLATETTSGRLFFEEQRTASVSASAELLSLQIDCLECDLTTSLSSDWDLRGRIPGELTVAWDARLARNSAGYSSCPAFRPWTEAELVDERGEFELELEASLVLSNDVTASVCDLVTQDIWSADFEAVPVFDQGFNPTLGGLVPFTYGRSHLTGSAQVEYLGVEVLRYDAFVKLLPITLKGNHIEATVLIENIANLHPTAAGGVSFQEDSVNPWDCDPVHDTVSRDIYLTQESVAEPAPIYVKPCVFPNSTFEVSVTPISYESDVTVAFNSPLQLIMNADQSTENVECPACIVEDDAGWSIPAASGSRALKFQVTVQEPDSVNCPDAYTAMELFCGLNSLDPLCDCDFNPFAPGCLPEPPPPEPGFDLTLDFGRVGSLPEGVVASENAILFDLDRLPDGVFDVAAENPSLGLGPVVPGEPSIATLVLRDTHELAPTLSPAEAAAVFEVQLGLFVAGGNPAGEPAEILSAQLDGVAVAPSLITQAAGLVELPTLANLADRDTHLLQLEWSPPDPVQSTWALNGHGKAACFPSSHLEATLAEQTALVAEFDGNNTSAVHFEPGFPDFVIEQVSALRDADVLSHPFDDHRWLEEDCSITLEARISNLGGDPSATGPDVPVFMTVQFVDDDGPEPTFTDSSSPAPVALPVASLGARMSANARFHYEAPPATTVSPQLYERVIFTFTVNDIPACDVVDGTAPCDCEVIAGAPSGCSCQIVGDLVECGSLPPAWGGTPGVFRPECGDLGNTGQVVVAYLASSCGDGNVGPCEECEFDSQCPSGPCVDCSCTLSVALASFEAETHAGDVTLTWTTESETDNEGFRVLRSTDSDGDFEVVSYFIPAEGGPVFGAEYEFVDDAVEPYITYYYLLEDLDTSGVSTLHGADACTFGADVDCEPLAVTVPGPSAADYCAEHQIRRRPFRARWSDRWACVFADWKDNEPDRRFPRDCTIARDRGSRSLICEARANAD